ncbi:MAG TPA: OmpA family protein, partial [Phaeodactylibacter sp.]|nr:OmpA family protein [Phaeodactylibacter sp.]
VGILNKYPTMKIELSSHTDSRGTRAYNEALSRKRAEAALKYLVARGIAPERLQVVGHGESQIRNRCTDGVDCSEKEHQFNRRTEIKILQR